MQPPPTHPQPTPAELPTVAPVISATVGAGAPPERVYEWLGELARGGMGCVYQVRDTRLNRTLAIKVLLEEHRDRADTVQRFLEEAQITGQLQHPGIVPIHELGALADGRPYFAMKLVKGQTLAELLSARQSPADDRSRFLAIFAQVCQALAYAHSKRVLHRDLKPANIMVGAFGEVQVMDWGLAKVIGGPAEPVTEEPSASVIETVRSGDEELRSRAGSVMGTYAYMPPEQARGEVDRLDERADVFGLGGILCEMLTGRPPYTGRSPGEVRARAMLADLGPAHEALRACGADEELVQLALRCLAALPEERPRDATELARSVAEHQAHVEARLREAEKERAVAEEQSRSAAAGQRLAEQATREAQRVGMLLALVILLGIAGVIGGLILFRSSQDRRARQQRIEARVEYDLKVAEAELEADRDGKKANWHHAEWALYSAAHQMQYHRSLPAEMVNRFNTAAKAVKEGNQQQQADERLLAKLNEARVDRALFPLGGNVDVQRESHLLREAFSKYGLHPEKGPSHETVKRLRKRPIALNVTAHLIEWLLLVAEAPASPANDALHAQLTAISVEILRQHPHPALPAMARDIAAGREALRRRARAADVLRLPPQMLRILGGILVSYDEREAGIGLLRRAARAYPSDAWLRRDLGGLLMASEATRQEAKEHFEAALALHPNAASVLVCLTAFPLLAGQTKDAVRTARRAVELTPRWIVARLNLAATLLADDRPGEAVHHLRVAAAQLPDAFEPYYMLCQALVTLGEWQAAASAARQAIALYRPRAGTGLLTITLTRSADRPWALRGERKEVSSLGMVYRKLAVAEAKRGRTAAALAAAREMVRLDPYDGIGHAFLGALLASSGADREVALGHLELAVCLGHASAECLANLCKVRLDSGDLDGAVDAGEAAVEVGPNDLHAWLNLAVAAYSAQRFERAAEALGHYLQARPINGPLHQARGDCLLRLGRYGEALRHFQAGCQMLPPGETRDTASRQAARLRIVVQSGL